MASPVIEARRPEGSPDHADPRLKSPDGAESSDRQGHAALRVLAVRGDPWAMPANKVRLGRVGRPANLGSRGQSGREDRRVSPGRVAIQACLGERVNQVSWSRTRSPTARPNPSPMV